MSTVKAINLQHPTSSSPNIVMDNAGNVGIGTSSPSTFLHVTNSGGYGVVGIGSNDSNGFHIAKDTGTNALNFYTGAVGSGTKRFGIDTSGRVTRPYQPTFHVGGGTAGGNNTLTQTSPTLIIWTVAVINTGSHYNTSTGLFTAPVAGTYRFDYMLQQRFSGGFQLWWYKNGSAIYRSGYNGSAGADDGPGMASSITLSLAANDTFAVYGARVGGSADAYLGGSGNYDISYFSGTLLG